MFVYHFTDILNAVGILQEEAILSRSAASELNLMRSDNASATVIQRRKDNTWGYARLYFRPRTPTQYNNEGFRPIGQRKNDSHCPVPVYFLMDAKEVLTLPETGFTDGNLAQGARICTTGKEFTQLPFDQIYHAGAFLQEDRDTIVYHRHAEVLVPQRLPVSPDTVKYIICRSPAEQATLLYLLEPKTRRKWRKLIVVQPKAQLFNAEWTYVESATLSDESITLHFNRDTKTPGPFALRMDITDSITGEVLTYTDPAFDCRSDDFRLDIDLAGCGVYSYAVELYLDNHIAFADTHVGSDIPF